MTANSINPNRLGNLLRYEFAMHRKRYLMGISGVFLMTAIVFLIIFYSNRNAPNWQQQDYAGLYYAEMFFLTIFGVGYSFIELRVKSSAKSYLTLPGSVIEKYMVQFMTRVLLFPIVFTILFVLGAEVSKNLFHLGFMTLYDTPSTLVIDNLDVIKMLPPFYWWEFPIVYNMVFGIGVLIISLMFAGGIIFGKGNPLLMPLSIIGFGLLVVLTGLLLSWILLGVPHDGTGLFSNHINLEHPQIFGETPLLVFVATVLIWLAIPIFFWVAYLKLKEREV